METYTSMTINEHDMMNTLSIIWKDLGDILIFLGILVFLYFVMKYIKNFLNKKNINIPVISYVFAAIIGIFSKKVTKVYKDGKELEEGTSEIINAMKDDLKKEENNEN